MLEQQVKPIRRGKLPFNALQAILDNIILIVVIITIGFIILVAAVLVTHKPYYTVSASILFEPRVPEVLSDSNDRYLHSFEDWMRTQSHELESSHVLQAAIENYEADGYKWRLPDETMKTAVDRLRGRLQTQIVPNTQLMNLKMGSKNKESLAEIVNAVVDEYIDHKDRQRQEQDQNKLAYLREKKTKYSQRLDQEYQDLTAISGRYGTAIADEKNMYVYLEMFMNLRNRYNQALTERIERENRLTALYNQKKRLKELAIYDLKNSQLLLEMEQEINSKMVGLDENNSLYFEYSRLLSEISENNIKTAKKYLIADIDRTINEEAMHYETARQTEMDINGEMDKAQLELMAINSAVLKTTTQRQTIDRITNIWARINDRIEQIEIELFNPGRVQVLSSAKVPEFPDPNKLMKKLILGVIAIVGLGVGTAAGKEYNDKRVNRTADVENVLGFPATGFMIDSSLENIPEDSLDQVYATYPKSYMVELYNELAVRVEREHHNHGARTFAMFSLKGKSGVSSVARNILAMLDADKHEKILIDLNHKITMPEDDINSPDGLIEWLAANRSLEDGIVNRVDSYFDVLPLGNLRELNIARIRPSAVQELFKRLQQRYKYIFIDCPPMLLASEAQTVAQEVDVSMLVVDSQRDTWPTLTRVVSILDKLQVQVVSVILNRIKPRRAGYIAKSLEAHYQNRVTALPQSGRQD